MSATLNSFFSSILYCLRVHLDVSTEKVTESDFPHVAPKPFGLVVQVMLYCSYMAAWAGFSIDATSQLQCRLDRPLDSVLQH